MNRRFILIIIVSVILLTVSAVTLFYFFYFIEEVQLINASARYSGGKSLGFNVDLDELSFGSLPANAPGHRNFFISHSKPYPLKVKIMVKGNLSQYLTLSKTDFILSPNVSEKIGGSVKFPQGTAIGNYTAVITIQFSKNI
ncbi:MAG TPA: hypothetical protein VJB90_02450 [Candidatus Nanoarchaeia archaeon]|nr:hypothetical protein [Candidatus Nanoarchaeia archaeon]